MVGPLRPQTDARAVVEPLTDFVADRTRDGRAFRMLCITDKFDCESLAIRVARKSGGTPKRFDRRSSAYRLCMTAWYDRLWRETDVYLRLLLIACARNQRGHCEYAESDHSQGHGN